MDTRSAVLWLSSYAASTSDIALTAAERQLAFTDGNPTLLVEIQH